MGRIRGITIVLYEKTMTGTDPFGVPVYEEKAVEVENVLVAPASTVDAAENTNIDGRQATYTLGIPKGDTHNWESCRVRFFGRDWKTVGIPREGIEELIPLDWNKKVQVEAYE